MIKLGPVLKFLGCKDNVWHISVMVVCDINDAAPSLTVTNQPASVAIKLCEMSNTKTGAWRWEYKISLKAVAQNIAYQLNGVDYALQVPA